MSVYRLHVINSLVRNIKYCYVSIPELSVSQLTLVPNVI